MSIVQNSMINLLRESRTIAVVGLSPKPDRASFRVAAYMQQAGYKIIPIRPGMNEILGETCYPSLEAIPPEITIDIVDVFRRAEQTPPIAIAAVKLKPRCFWLQSGIINQESMSTVTESGIIGIQDKCLMIEHRAVASAL